MSKRRQSFSLLSDLFKFKIDEYKTQIAHYSLIAALALMILGQSDRYAIMWCVIFVLYYSVLVYVGNSLKNLDHEDYDLYIKRKKLLKEIYLGTAIILLIIGGLISSIIQAFVVACSLVIGTIIFMLFDDNTIVSSFRLNNFDEKDPISQLKLFLLRINSKYPTVYRVLYYGALGIIVLFAVYNLPFSIWIKLFAILVYVSTIPLVALLAQNGADILYIFDS